MRIVIVGATPVGVLTATLLIDRGHELVVIEEDRARIDELSEQLDCAFLHGDGTKPAILREADPEATDVLFCLTYHDQVNILASLVGRSLGFKRVITSIEDPEFDPLCRELGLDETIIPSRTISRYLSDLVEGIDILELRTVIRGQARTFSFTASDDDAGTVEGLDLPEHARVICLYREGRFTLTHRESKIHVGDEVVILTHSKHLPELQKRWAPSVAGDSR